MSLFKNKFVTLLEQEEDEIAPPVDNVENPLEGETEPGVSPEQFGASVKPGEDIESLKQSSLDSQKTELQQWIQKIEEFKEYLNGTEQGSSIQTKLHDASCDTLFEKIASSEHKRLARVAVELSALAEAFKGYLIAGE